MIYRGRGGGRSQSLLISQWECFYRQFHTSSSSRRVLIPTCRVQRGWWLMVMAIPHPVHSFRGHTETAAVCCLVVLRYASLCWSATANEWENWVGNVPAWPYTIYTAHTVTRCPSYPITIQMFVQTIRYWVWPHLALLQGHGLQTYIYISTYLPPLGSYYTSKWSMLLQLVKMSRYRWRWWWVDK